MKREREPSKTWQEEWKRYFGEEPAFRDEHIAAVANHFFNAGYARGQYTKRKKATVSR